MVAAEKQQFIDDQQQRNAVEGKIGQGKRRYGLALILEKLPVTQGSSIAMNILVMNLQKLLELIFSFSFPMGVIRCLSWPSEGA
jgi:IS5 family transposase